jgi:trigger factor
VSDGDVTRFLDQVRNQFARAVALPPGTPMRKGHRAVIDFAGRIGGTPFEGGTGTAMPVVLGSGQMIPGFEEGILGMTPGQTREIAATFPADYHEPELAGKQAAFTVTLRAGEALSKPPLDADFCAKVSGGRITVPSELRSAIRQQLGNQAIQRSEQSIRSQVTEALLGQWNPEPGKREINKELDRIVQQQLQAAAQQGRGPAQGGPDAESIRKSVRPGVVKGLRLSKVLARVAKLEGIAVTDGEVEQFATQMAQQQGQDPQAFLSQVRQQNLVEVLRRQIIEDRVMTLILQNAIIEEPKRLALRRP